MNSNFKLDISYIAGLFDAKGIVSHRNKLWSYTTVKLHKIEQIIDHYEPDIQDVDDNLVDLALERQKRYGLKND